MSFNLVSSTQRLLLVFWGGFGCHLSSYFFAKALMKIKGEAEREWICVSVWKKRGERKTWREKTINTQCILSLLWRFFMNAFRWGWIIALLASCSAVFADLPSSSHTNPLWAFLYTHKQREVFQRQVRNFEQLWFDKHFWRLQPGCLWIRETWWGRNVSWIIGSFIRQNRKKTSYIYRSVHRFWFGKRNLSWNVEIKSFKPIRFTDTGKTWSECLCSSLTAVLDFCRLSQKEKIYNLQVKALSEDGGNWGGREADWLNLFTNIISKQYWIFVEMFDVDVFSSNNRNT